jgi:hypothetical protein
MFAWPIAFLRSFNSLTPMVPGCSAEAAREAARAENLEPGVRLTEFQLFLS